eukprot:902188_1
MAEKGGKEDEKKDIDILYIEFKWDKTKMKNKKQCDTKHMLYLLYLSLEKVRERTNERNEQFKNYGRNDRILQHPDYIQIITNFIDWHLKDSENNKFDGNYLETTPRIECTNTIKKIGCVKEGWAIKIYKYLKKDTLINTKWKLVKIPNYKHDAIGKTLKTLCVDDLINILQNYVFNECVKKAKNNNWQLDKYRKDIISFFEKENLNGIAFSKLKKME